jgi:hypothetical protein
MQLFLTPNTPQVWEQFCQFMRMRGQNPPPPPPEAIMVCTREGAFVAGTCLYPVNIFMFVEFGVTSPYAPLRLRHRAMELVGDTIIAVCAQRGLAPFLFPNQKGFVRMLQKRGLVIQRAVVMSQVPRAMPFADPEPKSSAPPRVSKAPSGALAPVTNAEEVNLPKETPLANPPKKPPRRA